MSEFEYENLAGRVVLVTGGGSGLGEAICTAMTQADVRVAVGDISEAAAQRVASRLQGEGKDARPYAMDVADEAAVVNTLKEIVGDMGPLDAIINNAGVDVTIGSEGLDSADWHRVIATNLLGPS